MSRSVVSINQLLADATSRDPVTVAHSLSGARFEWVVIGGERFFLKYQDARDDWLMRATFDDGRRYVSLWENEIFDALPDEIDHAEIGCAFDDGVGAVLMRDVSAGLVPEEVFSVSLHRRLLDHMAALHVRFWGWKDDIGLTPPARRYLAFSPEVASAEAALALASGGESVGNRSVPSFMAQGWGLLPSVSPTLAEVVMPLLDDPTPLLDALGEVPHTLVHGDWKAANLVSQPDGRTLLLDWGELVGEATPTADLALYLALNAALLPESKETTIATYRAALERRGVDTGGWWEAAIALDLLGSAVQFGWEKALGGPGPELEWWERRAAEGVVFLDR